MTTKAHAHKFHDDDQTPTERCVKCDRTWDEITSPVQGGLTQRQRDDRALAAANERKIQREYRAERYWRTGR